MLKIKTSNLPFLRPSTKKTTPVASVIPDVVLQAIKDKHNHEHSIRADGYEMAMTDLMQGLRGCNSFALVSIEPAIRQMQGKLRKMKQEN